MFRGSSFFNEPDSSTYVSVVGSITLSPFKRNFVKIILCVGRSDVRVVCGHITISTLYVVGQHGVLCQVKWWRFFALFE